jgi:hypothetical protein
MGLDYGFWLPNLLAGDFWHAHNSLFAMPWFTPSECAGAPLHADPQGAYLSVTQFLSFVVSPLRAVQWSFFLYAACGFAGTYLLAGSRFGCSRPASLLAALLFTLNGFYSARFLAGHLSFAPFVVVPAMAVYLLGAHTSRRGETARILLFGVLLAAMLQAGTTVMIPPALYSVAIIVVMHALVTGGPLGRPAIRGACGLLLGVALCAGKLAAVFALMGNLPRDIYPLPGFSNILQAAWVALRCVFLWPSGSMTKGLVHTRLILELHEFDYRVGPAPLILFGLLAWRAWQRRGEARLSRRTRLLWELLAALLVIPLAMNTYAYYWTAFLKLLPIIRNSSSLVRWFAAYMAPACIGAGLALDRLTADATTNRRWLWSCAAAALTCICLLASDRSYYGLDGIGKYNSGPIEASWSASTRVHQTPAVRQITIPLSADGTPDMSTDRGNQLAWGASPLLCYDPIFGYRLEAFHLGSSHAGPVLDERRHGDRLELNLKDPACYVFPGANDCVPGDNFTVAQTDQAVAFASYRAFAFKKPWWAHLADWISVLALAGAVAGAIWLSWPRRTHPKAHAS